MKKFIDTVPTGGAPVFGQELVADVLTKEIWEALEAMYGKIDFGKYFSFSNNNNIVISGGVVSDAGGGDRDITAGIAWFGEVGGIIARFPAVTGFTPGLVGATYINLAAATTEQKTFFDATDKDYFTVQTAAISASPGGVASVAGSLVEATATFPSLQGVFDYMTGHIHTVRYNFPPWDMVTDPSKEIPVSADGGIVSKENIVGITAVIRQDVVTQRFLRQFDYDEGTGASGHIIVRENDGDDGFVIVLTRVAVEDGGAFDDANYNDTGVQRGYVIVQYKDN